MEKHPLITISCSTNRRLYSSGKYCCIYSVLAGTRCIVSGKMTNHYRQKILNFNAFYFFSGFFRVIKYSKEIIKKIKNISQKKKACKNMQNTTCISYKKIVFKKLFPLFSIFKNYKTCLMSLHVPLYL